VVGGDWQKSSGRGDPGPVRLQNGGLGDRGVSARFRRRCGDLVLTHRELGTWRGDAEPDELDLVGMHGGLHPEEMLVPFAAVRADRL
jgi:hypothetical protein